MNKTELARSLAKEFDLSIVKSNEVVAYILDSMTKSLVKNKPVQLFGFGSFTVKKRKARAGRNPQTGETVKIPARKAIKFTVAKALKEEVNKK